MGAICDGIDWQRPWLAPFAQLARELETVHDWRAHMNAVAGRTGIVNHHGRLISFVDQAELPGGTAYESYISDTGRIPTRDNLHDFFNGLVWLAYPAAKMQLNAIQANEIAYRAANSVTPGAGQRGATRGTVRDRATIFDENAGILLTCHAAVETALREHRWREVLLDCRNLFGRRCEVRLFGHALIEKLVRPYKAITAHVWVLPVSAAYFDMDIGERTQAVDCFVSSGLRRGLLNTPSTPLPVLGVPGWYAPQNAAFYADAAVFRPKRTRSDGG